MKILVVSNMGPSKSAPNYGIFIENFCKKLSSIGVDYNWIYIKKSNNIFLKTLRYIFYFLRCFFTCLGGKYDYIYVHYLAISSIPVLFANKIKKLTIIGNAHGTDLAPENNIQIKHLKYTKALLNISHTIVVPSKYFKKYLENNFSDMLHGQKIIIYPSGGIDKQTFYVLNDNEKSKAYRNLGLSPNKKYIGYCGRITQNKGIDTLLEAFSKIKNNLDIELIIVGAGEYITTMKAVSDSLGISNKIHLYSMMTQNQLREVYNILELFIFPTERKGESLGLVAIEAMACGVPVIASDFAAPKYYIHDGYNGFKFKMHNSEDLKIKILTLLENKKLKKQMSENAVIFAQKYSSEKIVTILNEIFN